MSRWVEDSEVALRNIHTGMAETLRATTGDGQGAKEAVDAYLQEVCRLRELLILKVSEMQSWEPVGLHRVEAATLSRLNLT